MDEISKVMVMNSKAWEELSMAMIKIAETKSNPIEYIANFKRIRVIIDEEVPIGQVRIYNKNDFEKRIARREKNNTDERQE